MKICLVTLTETGWMPVCASQNSVAMTRHPINTLERRKNPFGSEFQFVVAWLHWV